MKTTIKTSETLAVTSSLSQWLNTNNIRFSELLERQVSNLQALSLVNLMVAFALLTSLAMSAWFVVLPLITYFVASVHAFVKSGIVKRKTK